MTIPPLSDEQRQQARHAATEARRRRAEIKQTLRSGERSLAEVLDLAETDDVVAHAKVIDVLKALPRVGSVRATKVMQRLDIAANRRLRGLGKHQTAALIARAGARSEQLKIEHCKTAGNAVEINPSFLPALGQGAEGFIESVAANSVNVTVLYRTDAHPPVAVGVESEPQRIRFAVTFYDMPVLESVRLPSGERIALTMTRFLSARTCERFWGELDESTRTDCDPVLAELNNHQRDCSRADITLTTIPAEYIGVRDRPYLNELTSPARNGGWLSHVTAATR